MNRSFAATARLGDSATGHESPEVGLPLTVVSAAGIAAMIILSAIVAHWAFYALLQPIGERSATPIGGEGLVLPPAPQLEGIEMMSGSPPNNLQTTATEQLQTYGWVDRDKRVIRVPIERAMQIAIERSWLPSAPAPPQNAGPSTPSASATGQK